MNKIASDKTPHQKTGNPNNTTEQSAAKVQFTEINDLSELMIKSDATQG